MRSLTQKMMMPRLSTITRISSIRKANLQEDMIPTRNSARSLPVPSKKGMVKTLTRKEVD